MNENELKKCPVCGHEVKRSDMNYTSDCHGIPYRLVCFKCWERLMDEGYDGEYYSEADECLEWEY